MKAWQTHEDVTQENESGNENQKGHTRLTHKRSFAQTKDASVP